MFFFYNDNKEKKGFPDSKTLSPNPDLNIQISCPQGISKDFLEPINNVTQIQVKKGSSKLDLSDYKCSILASFPPDQLTTFYT